jgi:hypothetical protein
LIPCRRPAGHTPDTKSASVQNRRPQRCGPTHIHVPNCASATLQVADTAATHWFFILFSAASASTSGEDQPSKCP